MKYQTNKSRIVRKPSEKELASIAEFLGRPGGQYLCYWLEGRLQITFDAFCKMPAEKFSVKTMQGLAAQKETWQLILQQLRTWKDVHKKNIELKEKQQ